MKPSYFQRGVALSALLALAVGGGCKVGSDYQKPNVSAQQNETYTHIEAEGVQQEVGADVSGWWSQINDPVLSQLTQEALSGNLTLREAMFRIQSARAALGSTNSNLLPQFAQDGGYAYQSYGGNSQNVFSTATSMSWELDVFGRVQRSIEAATADMEVQRELYRDAYVILVGDVAQAYVDARSYQDQIRIAKINILIQEATLHKYVDPRLEEGMMFELDRQRILGPIHNAKATVAALETQYQQALNRLSILVGRAPGYVNATMADHRPIPTPETFERYITLGGKGGAEAEQIRQECFAMISQLLLEESLIPTAPTDVLVGIPADLLRRRPDIRAAEQRIIAQNARVGVAVADLYPMFTLSGSFGLEADSFSNMFDSDAIAAGVGPAFRWNILNFGKYRFNIEAQRFVQEELIAAYRQTVLEAAEDVDNALALYVNEKSRNQDLRKAVKAYLEAFDTITFIQSTGETNIQPTLEALAGLLSNGLQYAQSNANATSSVVQLYRALGGDWYVDGSSAQAAATAAVERRQNARETELAEREERLVELEARLAERAERAELAKATAEAEPLEVADAEENAAFEIVADDELEASPELAEPLYATGAEAYADEVLVAE